MKVRESISWTVQVTVTVANIRKCEELMNKELDEEKIERQMLLLKESHDILSSGERRLYDWSLSRSENPDRYLWPFEVDITQTPTQSPPPQQEPEDVGPTRVVGWFFPTWLILSFALSVTFNR